MKAMVEMGRAERLIRWKFYAEPFHNFRLISGYSRYSAVPGGTCSDKALSFLNSAKRFGFEAFLHTGLISGKEIHRLVRLHIGGRVFFADVGRGWPSWKLFPSDKSVSYVSHGMRFRSEVMADRLRIFHERAGRETLVLEILLAERRQEDIQRDIDERFKSGVDYPFSSGPRFSGMVGDRFVFLKNDILWTFGENFFSERALGGEQEIHRFIRKYAQLRGLLSTTDA